MSRAAPFQDTAIEAIIYCRVSSKKQATEGAGLESQEHRCRDYAEAQGYVVEAVFPDDASGGGDFMNRPGMVALLAYLEARSDTNFVIIFDDLKTLCARYRVPQENCAAGLTPMGRVPNARTSSSRTRPRAISLKPSLPPRAS